jgi:hypothetical protein
MGTKARYIQESTNRVWRYVTPLNLFSFQCYGFDPCKSLPKVTHYKVLEMCASFLGDIVDRMSNVCGPTHATFWNPGFLEAAWSVLLSASKLINWDLMIACIKGMFAIPLHLALECSHPATMVVLALPSQIAPDAITQRQWLCLLYHRTWR